MKTVLGAIRRADEEFRLIEPGDQIAVGVSGGKDSLLLLRAMALYRFVRHGDFDIRGVMLTQGATPPDTSAIEKMCEDIGVPLTVKYTDLYQIIFEQRKDRSPCALCAKMRRAMLCEMCQELGCNKLALGHHRDDVLETLLMSLLFEGRFHTFHPKTRMSRMGITVIRPMVYVTEKHSIHMAKSLELPVLENPCPANGYTKREEMKGLLDELCRRYPKAREMMLSALRNDDQYALWQKDETKMGRF